MVLILGNGRMNGSVYFPHLASGLQTETLGYNILLYCIENLSRLQQRKYLSVIYKTTNAADFDAG